jgi:segregation and condensation protein A
MAYQVHLDNFEGPLDLLLYFIQRDKIDIYDIPISHIASEYLSYLELMETLNIAVAGEFILLAATLMRIKARMLLPHASELEDEMIDDPRQDLVQRLIEYQQIKQASQDLRECHEERGLHYPVGLPMEVKAPDTDPSDYLQDVTLYQLLAVFKEVMDRLPPTEPLIIHSEPIKLDTAIRKIHKAIAHNGRLTFCKLLESAKGIHEVIVLFLAVLDMIRKGTLAVEQPKPFDELHLMQPEAN